MALGWNKAQRQQRPSATLFARPAEKRAQRYIVSGPWNLPLVGDMPAAPASLRRGCLPALGGLLSTTDASISATAWRIGSTRPGNLRLIFGKRRGTVVRSQYGCDAGWRRTPAPNSTQLGSKPRQLGFGSPCCASGENAWRSLEIFLHIVNMIDCTENPASSGERYDCILFPASAELLETLLEEYEMDLDTCAARSRLDMSILQDLLAARRDVDEDIALKLGRCFSGTQETWLRHQAFHDSGLPSKISRDAARTRSPAVAAKRYKGCGRSQLP